ncbi:unnamed protein product [Mytilus edulis]|uniref:B box-type domain-containing protein n=1 Tax=Mytilus edulis TaxID=6550 RepID=A0A8S3TGJ3_MYTED|nr:unnamed protein product [Mytilus edulis]
MASGNHISCGPCMFDDVTKDAGRWCTNCEEGLCEDCENVHRKGKTTRNHKVITIEDYRKIEHVSISQVCEHHGENLEWFCKSHDEVLCVACVPSKHKACSDVVSMNESSANSRQSAALYNLEETIEGTLQSVKLCIKNRESATKEIEKQELEVKTMVLETRKKINGQLDKLQEKLLHELSDKGKHIRDIPVSGPPFDIDVIDLDRIVATYKEASFIEIMNTNTFNVEKKISFIRAAREYLTRTGNFIIHGQSSILTMDLSGKQLGTLNVASKGINFIKTSRGRYFTQITSRTKYTVVSRMGKNYGNTKLTALTLTFLRF